MPKKIPVNPFRCTGCGEPREPEDATCPGCHCEGIYVPLRVEDASRPGSRVLGPRVRKFEEAQIVRFDEKWRDRKRWPSILAAAQKDWEFGEDNERSPGITPVGVKPTPGKDRIPLYDDWIQELARRRRAKAAPSHAT